MQIRDILFNMVLSAIMYFFMFSLYLNNLFTNSLLKLAAHHFTAFVFFPVAGSWLSLRLTWFLLLIRSSASILIKPFVVCINRVYHHPCACIWVYSVAFYSHLTCSSLLTLPLGRQEYRSTISQYKIQIFLNWSVYFWGCQLACSTADLILVPFRASTKRDI